MSKAGQAVGLDDMKKHAFSKVSSNHTLSVRPSEVRFGEFFRSPGFSFCILDASKYVCICGSSSGCTTLRNDAILLVALV